MERIAWFLVELARFEPSSVASFVAGAIAVSVRCLAVK